MYVIEKLHETQFDETFNEKNDFLTLSKLVALIPRSLIN